MSDELPQVEYDASKWRRHRDEFYKNRGNVAILRAETARLQAQLADILDASPRCNGCDLPMRHLGPEPGRWGCSQCGAIHLYADPTPATAPIICPGSGAFVPADAVDGSWVTRCPTCARWTVAHQVPGTTRFMSVRAHCPLVHPDLGIHRPACDARDGGDCTCTGTPTPHLEVLR